MKLWVDTETFSETPIKHGTYRYVDDSELMVVSFAIDDGPVSVLDLTEPMTLESAHFYNFQLAMMECDEIIAHNAMFDRNVLRKHMPNWTPPLERWRCNMVRALSHSLPGGLDKLCEILRVPQDQAKLKVGKELVRLFCMPRPKNAKIRRATRETHPVEWQRFLDYAGADILSMRATAARMPSWNYQGAELAMWHRDQQINDRGFAVDLEFADAAVRATEREQDRLSHEAYGATGGAVTAATQRDALLEHILEEYGVSLPDMQGSTLERRLGDPDLPDAVKDLIRIRLQASTTSTTKYKAILRGHVDGRLRGTLQFNGAGRTGRWAGRTFQPQNLKRVPKYLKSQWEFAVDTIKGGAVDLVFDDPMDVISSTVRGVIVAPEGRKLVVADLSNIEGRTLAWGAGEAWKVKAFSDFDAGIGFDLYKLAYAKSFNVNPADVDDGEQRQIGKVQELMLGYEGGVGAYITGAATYRIDLEAMTRSVWETLPAELVDEAADFYAWSMKTKRSTFGLSREAFITCDVLKRGWRRGHPATVDFWAALESACVMAVENPGTTFTSGVISKYNRPDREVPINARVRRDGAWLRVVLPSGRALCYPQPRVDDGKLSYMGVNQYTRKWQRLKTYGGKLTENWTQAVARDVLASNMPRVEEHGFEIVLTVHDELLTEAEDRDLWNAERLAALMSTAPSWAPGLPLAAAGFEARRYRKD